MERVKKLARQFSTEDELYNCALRALMRRSHCVHEMRAMLERRASEKSLVPPVMDRLKDHGYLDDFRYAREFARSHANLRRQGRFRIARELRSRGVPDRCIEAALDGVFAETDERAILHARIERRAKFLRAAAAGGKIEERKLASLYGSLLRAGFPAAAIRDELRALRLPSPEDSDVASAFESDESESI